MHLKTVQNNYFRQNKREATNFGIEVKCSITQVKGKRFYVLQIHACHKGDSKSLYSPLRGCAGDRVGMVVKCIVGLFWGVHFQHGGKFVPQNSPTMHFDNHLAPVFRATSKWQIVLTSSRKTPTVVWFDSVSTYEWSTVSQQFCCRLMYESDSLHLSRCLARY